MPLCGTTDKTLYVINMNVLRKMLFLFFLLILSGCAVVVVSGAGLGVSYTLSNVAYKTFSKPLDVTHDATVYALKKMDIRILDNVLTTKGRKITAATRELRITINLEKITSKATRIKVDARKRIFLKDKATAVEIIAQVDKFIKDNNQVKKSLLNLRLTILAIKIYRSDPCFPIDGTLITS